MPEGDGAGHGLIGEQKEHSETQGKDFTENKVRDH